MVLHTHVYPCQLYRAIAVCADIPYLVILPTLLYLGSLGTWFTSRRSKEADTDDGTASGIGLLIETAKPGAVFGQASVVDFGTPFWSISVSMNVLTTLVIAGKLVYRKRAFVSTERSNRLSTYTPEVAIFLESAALYAICAIIYIPMFARSIPLQYPFSALLVSAAVSFVPWTPNDISLRR